MGYKHVQLIVFLMGAILLVTFGSIAIMWSGRLARKIESAAAAATTLARGEIPRIEKCSVIEVEHLNQNLVNGASLLRAREAQLIEAKVAAEAANVPSPSSWL
jgi:hypothetical protein